MPRKFMEDIGKAIASLKTGGAAPAPGTPSTPAATARSRIGPIMGGKISEEAQNMAAKAAMQKGAKTMKSGGAVKKMAKGGMCRGMGAAKKGGKYGKSG